MEPALASLCIIFAGISAFSGAFVYCERQERRRAVEEAKKLREEYSEYLTKANALHNEAADRYNEITSRMAGVENALAMTRISPTPKR